MRSKASLRSLFLILFLLCWAIFLTSCGTIPAEQDANDQLFLVEEVVIGLLLVAVIVGIVAHRLNVPYTIGLVVVGLILTLGVKERLKIAPNVILSILVPPLIFEAAFHLKYEELRENLAHIVTLAVPGVLFTTWIAAYIVHWGTGMAISSALVFGAVVAATDPVSVVALFRRLGVPSRLRLIIEGESLFNDGTAIVVYHIIVAAALAGSDSLAFFPTLLNFVKVAGGGIIVGAILGFLVSELISRIDDHLIETTLTTILAYGAYLIGEYFGVSGVLAVVVAGLINGNVGPRGMSPTTHIVVLNFWEYIAFIANTFVFLLIGLNINLAILLKYWTFIVWAVIAVLITRAITVYTLPRFRFPLPRNWLHILNWGGLRGAICLALALSLPQELGTIRSQIQVMAFGVVLFTLLVQGLSMDKLVKKLSIMQRPKEQDEYERRHARAVIARSAYAHLERRYRQGLISEHVWLTLSPILEQRAQALSKAVKEILIEEPSLEEDELNTARREYLRAKRSTLNTLRRDGVINDEIYEQLAAEIDTALLENGFGWTELLSDSSNQLIKVDRLLIVIIQEEDFENVINGLIRLGVSVTYFSSKGGFLRRKNITLLIGFQADREDQVIKELLRNCRKRIEYVPNPLDLGGVPSTLPIEVELGGATGFSLEVEHFEMF
ncbi:MAG: Na+/H+ antiporter [Anaerolineales bacterium]